MTNEFKDAAIAEAKVFGIDPHLVCALAEIESGWNPLKADFDSEIKEFITPEKFALITGASPAAEAMFQACTWGLLQVTGAEARRFGFKDPLQNLCSIWAGTEVGCLKLAALAKEYPDEADLIAAFDAGVVEKRPDGRFLNQPYVDRVMKKLNELRRAK